MAATMTILTTITTTFPPGSIPLWCAIATGGGSFLKGHNYEYKNVGRCSGSFQAGVR